MDDNKAWVVFLVIVGFLSFGFLGFISGISLREFSVTRETTIACIEQPKVCKTKYDYYKLPDTKYE